MKYKNNVIFDTSLDNDDSLMKQSLLRGIDNLTSKVLHIQYTTEFIDMVKHLNMYHIKLFSIVHENDYCYIYRTYNYDIQTLIQKSLSRTLEPKDISFVFKINNVLYSISIDKGNKNIILKFYRDGIYNIRKLNIKDNLWLLQSLFDIPIIIRYEDPSKVTIDNIINSTLTNTELDLHNMNCNNIYRYSNIISTFKHI
jgi:hypothetical protein